MKTTNELARIEKIKNLTNRLNGEWLKREEGWKERVKEIEADLRVWQEW